MAVGARHPILLAYLLLQLLLPATTQECVYQYIHQPSQELECNPYGRELQLHCGFIGPLSPEFNLGWYSSSVEDSSESPRQLVHGKEDYTVNNIVLDMKTGHYIRSVSSVLRTGPIDDEHSGRCLWCQAEFGDIAHPLKSNALCIHDERRYAKLDKCSDAVLVNTSLICADVTDDFMNRLRKEASLRNERDTLTNPTVTTRGVSTLVASQAEPIPSPSPSTEHNSVSTGITISSSVYKQLPSSMSLDTNSMVTSSIAPIVIPTPTVVPTTPGEMATPTDTPAISGDKSGMIPGPGAGLMEEENSTNPNIQSKSNLEGPLYAAIAICVIFIVVIVVLVSAIVCLMKKKCGCLTLWIRSHLLWKKTTATTIAAVQSHALGNTIVEGSDMQAMLESGLHGSNSVSSKEETDNRSRRVRSPHVRVSIEREQVDATDKRERATSLPCNGEIRQLEKRKSRLSDELPPPILVAKSATENEHESSGDYESIEKKCDYDHLQPAVESDHDNALNEEHQYAELESSVKKVPPKKPPRPSHSREHYYHTLESSDESGLLHSAGTSQAGSQLSGMNEHALASSVPGPTTAELSISNQLQELFDDPRYAVLFVNQDHMEHIHLDKNEVSRSRSTPSLIAVDIIPFSPTSPERRSLRAVHHKRLSILNSHLVQPQN